MAHVFRHPRPWMALVVIGMAACVVGIAALNRAAVGEGYPSSPDADMAQKLEEGASNIAATDNVAKVFPQHGEVVLTTQGQALALEDAGDGVTGPTDQPVYMVQVTGEFEANNVSVPPGYTPGPIGAFYVLVSPATGEATDFGTSDPVDLSKLGKVSEIDLTPPASPSPPADRSGAP